MVSCLTYIERMCKNFQTIVVEMFRDVQSSEYISNNGCFQYCRSLEVSASWRMVSERFSRKRCKNLLETLGTTIAKFAKHWFGVFLPCIQQRKQIFVMLLQHIPKVCKVFYIQLIIEKIVKMSIILR